MKETGIFFLLLLLPYLFSLPLLIFIFPFLLLLILPSSVVTYSSFCCYLFFLFLWLFILPSSVVTYTSFSCSNYSSFSCSNLFFLLLLLLILPSSVATYCSFFCCFPYSALNAPTYQRSLGHLLANSRGEWFLLISFFLPQLSISFSSQLS